jgi:hypothetical protein
MSLFINPLSSLDAIPYSDQNITINLGANVVFTYTIPGTKQDKYRAEFSWPYDGNVYVGFNVTPVLPANGTINEVSKVEFRPHLRFVVGGDVLSFISDSNMTNGGMNLLLMR